jgi:hypothetical protein
MALPLAASDEPDRFCIHLYHRTATQVDLSSKRVLEVSCGHGGGASYLVRTLCPASDTGLDLNPAGIEFCRKGTICPAWISCTATPRTWRSPTNPSTRLLNVEASHLYSRFPRFLAEVVRGLPTSPAGTLIAPSVNACANTPAPWSSSSTTSRCANTPPTQSDDLYDLVSDRAIARASASI